MADGLTKVLPFDKTSGLTGLLRTGKLPLVVEDFIPREVSGRACNNFGGFRLVKWFFQWYIRFPPSEARTHVGVRASWRSSIPYGFGHWPGREFLRPSEV
jgi:hypothetical protein